MTEHKYTDEEVIKALKVCAENDPCDKCPYEGLVDCARQMHRNAFALINRQREEIAVIKETTAEIRYEAIKEVVSEIIDIIKQRIKDNKYLASGVSSDIWKGIYRGRYYAYQDIKEIIEQKYVIEPSPAPGNTCICCGEIIPEGRQVCPSCEKQLKNYKPKGVKTKTMGKYVAPGLGVQLTIDDMENNND